MFEELKKDSRLLIKAHLWPLQGERFQPTGFADLGPATFGKNGKNLIVESTQSVANRLEAAIWDSEREDIVEPLQGIPYVVVKNLVGVVVTNSILEAHRLNSFYILETDDTSFLNQLKRDLGVKEKKEKDKSKLEDSLPIKLSHLAQVISRYDCNTLLHGVFFSKSDLSGGRFKLPRALSGFIDANEIDKSDSGGTKVDRVSPSATKEEVALGAGNVPFHRFEFTAKEIIAYFNLDLSQLRSYRLGWAMEELLIGMAIYKIQKFLSDGLRLRTACDLGCKRQEVTRPEGFKLPDLKDLVTALPGMVKAAYPQGGQKTEVKFIRAKKDKKSNDLGEDE